MSKINLVVVAVGALLGFPMLFVISLPPWLRLVLLVGFLTAMMWDLYLILLKGRYSVVAFLLMDSADRRPENAADGNSHGEKKELVSPLAIRLAYCKRGAALERPEAEGIVLPGSFVSPWFTAIKYKLPTDPAWRRWWPRAIPLWRDSIDAEPFRKVRVALKWK